MTALARASLAGCAVLALASLAEAQAPRELVPTRVEPLFGEGTLTAEAYHAVLVTVENGSGRDLAGEVELRVHGYGDHFARHEVPVDLPRGATRQVVVTVFVDGRASHVGARYVADERPLGRGEAGLSYAGGARSVLVLGDPPRLRGALIDLDVTDLTLTGHREVRAPVGAVRFDPANGDPMLPAEPAALGSVRLLVASAPVLARASEAQRAVIADWVRAGGRMLVLPRVASDLEDPFLRALAGPVAAEPSEAQPPLVPRGVPHLALSCSEGQRAESFGCSAPVGFGRVFLAGYDAASPAAIESGVSRELVRSLYAPGDDVGAALPFGRGHDDLARVDYFSATPSFGTLRAALDPNEAFRPALVLVAIVLLLYVIVVGPLNFRWVQKKQRPALALVTTPLAALACLGLLLAVGYVGKGVSMRYRRFELVEVVEGQERAPARRYTGLFATRPGAFDLDGPAPGEVAHRLDGSGERGPVHRHEGARVRLADFRAGLWETVFVREDRVVGLGGAVRFERDGRRLAAVVNDTPLPLEDAFVVDGAGAIYVVGDVAPGAQASIPRRSAGAVALATYAPADAVARELARLAEIEPDDAAYVGGLIALTGTLATGLVPVLYARVPASAEALGAFAPERDERWIRVLPALPGSPVAPALPPAAGARTHIDVSAPPEEPEAGADAGAPAASGPEVLP